MSKLFYHGVKVYWYRRRPEMFRYDTAEQAEEAARYQSIENFNEVRFAIYVGRRLNWRGLSPAALIAELFGKR